MRSLASGHAADRVLVEDAGAGTALVQELLGEVNGILAVKPDRNKITRYVRRLRKVRVWSGLFP